MLTGTLADVGLDELATLLHQQARTGVLTLETGTGRVRLFFRDGQMCQVDDERRAPSMHIGELLVSGGLITRSGLASALEEQATNRKPLGAILVGLGLVGLSDLFRYLDLQFRETLYPLYTATEGRFSFDASGYAARNCAPPPLPVEDVAMEALRRIDEFPEIRTWVSDQTQRFYKATASHFLPPDGPLADEIHEREASVFEAIGLDERIHARSLVGRTGMSTFDVMKGMAVLYRAGHLVPVDVASAASGAFVGVPTRRTFAQRRAGYVRAVLFLSVVITVSVTALALVTRLYLDFAWEPEGHGTPFEEAPSVLRDLRTDSQLGKLSQAIEVFRLEQGAYPEALDALVSATLLESEDLTFPDFENVYHYRRTTTGFVLLPPTR